MQERPRKRCRSSASQSSEDEGGRPCNGVGAQLTAEGTVLALLPVVRAQVGGAEAISLEAQGALPQPRGDCDAGLAGACLDAALLCRGKAA